MMSAMLYTVKINATTAIMLKRSPTHRFRWPFNKSIEQTPQSEPVIKVPIPFESEIASTPSEVKLPPAVAQLMKDPAMSKTAPKMPNPPLNRSAGVVGYINPVPVSPLEGTHPFDLGFPLLFETSSD